MGRSVGSDLAPDLTPGEGRAMDVDIRVAARHRPEGLRQSHPSASVTRVGSVERTPDVAVSAHGPHEQGHSYWTVYAYRPTVDVGSDRRGGEVVPVQLEGHRGPVHVEGHPTLTVGDNRRHFLARPQLRVEAHVAGTELAANFTPREGGAVDVDISVAAQHRAEDIRQSHP